MAKAASTKASAAKASSSASKKAPSSTKASSTKATKATSSKTAAKAPAQASSKSASKSASSALQKKSTQRSSASEAVEPTLKTTSARTPTAHTRATRGVQEREEDSIVGHDNDYDTHAEHDTERSSEERDSSARSRLQRPTVRYSDEELEFFRKHIEAERKKALEEFQILKENLEDITNSEMADENASYSMHMAEQGSSAQEKEKIYAQVQRIGDYIKKLEEALQRIDDKVYGICKMCGILIAKERLLAVPITTQSASYKIFKKCPEDGIDRIVRR
jgi:RNA polymerase-binding transcription factor DksA